MKTRVLFALLLTAAGVFGLKQQFYTSKPRKGNKSIKEEVHADLSIAAWFLAVIVVLALLPVFREANWERLWSTMFLNYVTRYLSIGLYYMLLSLALPVLRKNFDTRTTALLWFLPNLLYFSTVRLMQLDRPLGVILISRRMLMTIGVVWFIGFLIVFFGSVIRHLLYRRSLRITCMPLQEESVRQLWENLLEETGAPSARKIPLYTSSAVSSPVTVGLFDSTMFVVLPTERYSKEALSLIFRHELTHIRRGDNWAKFFLRFCTAVCWYNPFLWISMRQCAEDLELSCDEAVLEHAEQAERRHYAALVLNAAGDARGFTTCLSASSQSLKYRLERIFSPTRKKPGLLLAGAVFFCLLLVCNTVAFAYGGERGREVLFHETEELHLEKADYAAFGQGQEVTVSDVSGFNDYLADLELYRMVGFYEYRDNDRALWLRYRTPEGFFSITLKDQVIEINNREYRAYYTVKGGLDWETIDQFLS